MKKNLLFLLGFGLFFSSKLSAQYSITDLGVQAQHADISAVDIDGDGDLDIVITGQTSISSVFLNDGSGHFTAGTNPFMGLTFGNMDWGDINQDGKLDMIQNGFPDGQPPFASVYTSDGAGTFTQHSPAGLPQLSPSCGFADLNNDGYLDIFVFGNYFDGKCKILFNDKMGGFTTSSQFENYSWIDPIVTVVDYDNDMDLDLFVTAFDDVAKTRYSKMFVNNNGTFTETDLHLIQKGYGSAVWGDYNGDGFVDLLLNGDGGADGESSNDIYRLYRNVNGTFTADATFSTYRQISTGDGGKFADWDNDGDLDIIITGYSETAKTQQTAIFLNNGGTFTPDPNNSRLPGVSESSIEVADIDGDTDLDLLITGYSGNGYNPGDTFKRKIAIVVTNPSNLLNLAPTAPSNLNVSGNQASLMLSWDAATDNQVLGRGTAGTPQAALSYNIFLVDAAGKWFYYPLADTTTGKLKLQRMGNVNLNKGWIVKGLPAGTYRWGVQAIDNSFMGSMFATSSFTLDANGTLPVNLKSFTAAAEGKKSRIEWATASEQDNSHFEIQRSSDGKAFYNLATIAGKGTTASISRYVVYDNNPSAGLNYYKLIQTNIDGNRTEFGVKTVNFDGSANASVIAYPNPAQNTFGVRLSNFAGNQVTVTITDMSGKVMHKEIISAADGQGYYPLHIKSKPLAGQYLVNVNGDGLKQTLKVIIR